MSKYRQFFNETDQEDMDFTVFIIHGRSPEIRKVERYIKDDLSFNAIILQDSFTGRSILEKFKETIWEKTVCAVAIMSPDDKLDSGNYRARQNVFFELGYCSGVFDGYFQDEDNGDFESEPIIILKEKSIDFKDVSDLLGVEYLEYSQGNIEMTFPKLRKALNKLYEELGGKDHE